jgi:hypothetical protein
MVKTSRRCVSQCVRDGAGLLVSLLLLLLMMMMMMMILCMTLQVDISEPQPFVGHAFA